jgi:hypothetical protein
MVSKLTESCGTTAPTYILSTSSSKYIDNSMEALNKALALKPGDDLIKMALEKVMQFAAEQTMQEPFFLDTRDQGCIQKKISGGAKTIFEEKLLKNDLC